MSKTVLSFFRQINSELKSLNRFMFDPGEKEFDLLFFSSQAQYISYYEGLLSQLLNRTTKPVLYLSSDRNDPMLSEGNQGIAPYYSSRLLPVIFPLIDLPVLITTIPDLHQYKIKRSFLGTNHVYVFHSLVSTHMMYRLGAFDYYDTVLCTGPYQAAEIRQTESLYGLPKKTIHEVGYSRLEKIYTRHQEYLKKDRKRDNAEKLVLIAPGWHETNILNTCAEELIASVLSEGFLTVLRPHPMTISKSPQLIANIRNKFSGNGNFRIDTETVSEDYLHLADVMISDWSGVTLEYALGTERPVLFVDLPRKIYNPEYEKLGMEPLEVRIRGEIGKVVALSQVGDVGKIAREFIDHREEYQEQIIKVRKENISNFGQSSEVGADIVADILARDIKGRVQT
jgi:hypothetical protein